MREEDLLMETETTFDSVEFPFLWAVFSAWWRKQPLVIKLAKTRIVMTDETKRPK